MLQLQHISTKLFIHSKFIKRRIRQQNFDLKKHETSENILQKSYVPLESGRNVFAQPPMPRTAMEQSGHAQVPTLLVALVWRQAGRAGWTAEIGCKNTEE